MVDSSPRTFRQQTPAMNFSKEDLIAMTREVERLSCEIGAWMKQQTISTAQTEMKSFNNLVTFVDKESERRFVEGLTSLLPEAGYVAEEGTGEKNEGGYNWVIDPLDGTTNFVHGMNIWCTSVALVGPSGPIIGVIFDPNTNELFSSSLGNGATLNGQPIRVSSTSPLHSALLATGFPYDDFDREHYYYDLLKNLAHKTRGLRRLGSAALDMAWTACGRLDGFYEYGLNAWDVAAGTLLIREAGGIATTFDGGDDPIFGNDLVCTNPHIYADLIKEIKDVFEKS